MENISFHAYTWFSDYQDYLKFAAASLKQGVLPVLAPPRQKRRACWETVLDWYGLNTVASGVGVDFPPVKGHDLIVAFDTPYSTAAQLYAAAQGRPFYLLAGPESLEQLLARTDFTSLLLAGPPELLKAGVLRNIAQKIKVPWGVLTAQDLPGFTFVIAKLLAETGPTYKDRAIVNRPFATLQVMEAAREPGPVEEHDIEKLRELLFRRDWLDLALVAHGEGGHVTLNEIVLCGLAGETEQNFNGEELAGCRAASDESPRRCKRVISPKTDILTFGELRARQLFLFTCTSFAVAGELYPSNVSAVLSALEGYPASVLATDRVLPVDTLEPQVVLGLLRQGNALGPTVQFLNDLHFQPTRPYYLFGDPRGQATVINSPGPQGEITTSNGQQVLAIKLPGWLGQDITGLEVEPESNSESPAFVRGARVGAVVLPPGFMGNIRLVNLSERWQASKKWFLEMGLRNRRASMIEQAIARLYQSQVAALEERQTGLEILRQSRMALEELLQSALHTCELARRLRAWDIAIDHWQTLLAEQAGQWDRQLARLMADFIFSGQAYLLLADGFDLEEEVSQVRCDRCGSPLNDISASDPFGQQPLQFRVECPLCGGREGWSETTGRLHLEFPPALLPGQIVSLRLKLSASALPLPAQLPAGWLVVKVHDKMQRTFFQKIVRAKPGQYSFEFQVPDDISPELHMVQAAWIHGLDFTTVRRRWPAFSLEPARAGTKISEALPR